MGRIAQWLLILAVDTCGETMVILIGKLTREIGEDEVGVLAGCSGDVASVHSLGQFNNLCVIALLETSGVVIYVITGKLYGRYWHGV